MEVRIGAPSEAGAVEQRTCAVHPRTLGDLGGEEGGAVAVAGTGRTVLSARPDPEVPESTLVLAEVDREAAGVDVGDRATAEPVALPTAERVVATVENDVGVRGGQDALDGAIRGHPVDAGDPVAVSAFALTVRFVVREVHPDGPAWVGPETAVEVRDAAGGATPAPDPDRSSDDLGGLDEELAAVRRLVAAPLADDSAVDALGGYPVGGVLLHGPSGVGKTRLARAVGAELDAAFLPVTPASEFYDGTVDADAVVRAATERAPTLVFVDDLDVLAPAPDAGGSADRSTAELAAALDALDDRENVAVLAATSDPEAVDRSLRRGGRLSHEVELTPPDREGRRAVLDVHFADVPLRGVDLDAVAGRTHGFVGADLAELAAVAVEAATERVAPADPTDPPGDPVAVRPVDVEAALSAVVPSGLRAARIEDPSVTYDDIGGLEAVKRDLVRAVEWPVAYPDLFDRLRTDPPGGALLYGPPGTGKTMLARAVANSSSANFVPVDGPEVFDRYVGESERAIREVFARARENAPAVVFLDEVDALAADREAGGTTDVTDRVVSQLLTELDGIEPAEDVVVVGATNRPDLVDPALLRPGRLEKALEVGLPDRDAREEIFRIHAADVPVGDVDVAALAARTDGYTGSDVAAVVREASLLAMEDTLRETSFDAGEVAPGDLVVDQSHLDRALEVVDPSVTDEMRRRYEDVSLRGE